MFVVYVWVVGWPWIIVLYWEYTVHIVLCGECVTQFQLIIFAIKGTVADPGFGRRGGVNCHRQGRSPCSRHQVASGGWVKWRVGGGDTPLPMWKKMEIRKCLEDFWSTPKSVFCKVILYINIDIAHFNYKIVQNRSLFFRGGGGGACGKTMVERKCKSENA